MNASIFTIGYFYSNQIMLGTRAILLVNHMKIEASSSLLDFDGESCHTFEIGKSCQKAADSKEFSRNAVFVCSRDSHSFDSLAKDHIFVVPNLTLHGLDCILNQNVE